MSIIISAESRWVFQQTPPPQLRVKRPELVEVPPLGKEEQMRFIQALLPERQRPLWNLDKIQQFLATINGYPGEIQQRLQLKLMTQAQRYSEPDENQDDVFSNQLEQAESNLEPATERRSVPVIKILAASISLALIGFAGLKHQAIIDYFNQQPDSVETAEVGLSRPLTTEPPREVTQQLPS